MLKTITDHDVEDAVRYRTVPVYQIDEDEFDSAMFDAIHDIIDAEDPVPAMKRARELVDYIGYVWQQ